MQVVEDFGSQLQTNVQKGTQETVGVSVVEGQEDVKCLGGGVLWGWCVPADKLVEDSMVSLSDSKDKGKAACDAVAA